MGELDEDVTTYISNEDCLYKISVTHFFKKFCTPEDLYLDLVVLCRDKEKFREFVNLVPMQLEINCTTGLFEISHLVSFVTNSKFKVWKFFGFELEDDEPKGDFQVPR